jgi:uncharacterized membrane protein
MGTRFRRCRARRRAMAVAIVSSGLASTLLASACVVSGPSQPVAGSGPAAQASEVTATDLPELVFPIDRPTVDINNRGQIVGVRSVDGERHIAVWDDGQVTDIGPYEARSCVPMDPRSWCGVPSVDINDRGQVGTAIGGHAVLWQDGRLIDIDGEAEWSGFLGLNERGQALIVQVMAEQQIVALWSRGRLHEIAFPIAAISGHLSNQGHVVVTGLDPDGGDPGTCPTTSFLWHRGQYREIGPLSPREVNGRGQVIGTACEIVDGTSRSYEALWEDGEIKRLPGLDGLADLVGGNPMHAQDINDQGQIVGYNVLTGPHPGSRRRQTVLWENGEVTDVGSGTGGNNRPVAIDERGRVLINAHPDEGDLPGGGSLPTGFLWDDEDMVRMPPPVDNPYVSLEVHALNDHGQIVGHRGDIVGPNTSAVLWEVR